jgi:prepilin-type N-terminal cleavage/methylation domain-containing protein
MLIRRAHPAALPFRDFASRRLSFWNAKGPLQAPFTGRRAVAGGAGSAQAPGARGFAPSGFTLLEVMLAVTIFSLIMLSMFTLLNTSARTLERSNRVSDSMVRARGVFDTLARDFRTFYFENESDYNTNVRQTLEQLEAQRGQVDENGRVQRLDSNGNPLDEEDEETFLLPIEIDLAFAGQDGDALDELSFVTHLPNEPGGFSMPWGARRVHYFVREGGLYRSEDTIFKENVQADGSVEAKPEPELEKVSDGVTVFDLQYWYWKDGEWFLAPDWDSASMRYRFPGPEGTAEELGISEEEYSLLREQELPDDSPAMVEATLGLEDPGRPGRVERYRQIFRLYRAQETAFEVDYSQNGRGNSRGSSSSSSRRRGNR